MDVDNISYFPQQHKRNTQNKPYKCDKCWKTFAFLSSVKRHAKSAHSGDNVFRSNQNVEAFTMTPQLQDHQYTYSGFEPYTCKQCEKQFMDIDRFITHQQIHTGVKQDIRRKRKPHRYKECGNAFRRAKNLSKHKCTNEKPYSLRQQQDAQAGKKSQSSDQCGMTLVKSENPSNKHINSEEKAYKCGQCGKAFKNESTLRDHSLWHSKRVVIPCGECGKIFSSRQMYLSHKCLCQPVETAHTTNNCQ